MHRPSCAGCLRIGRSRAAAGLACLMLLGLAAGCASSGKSPSAGPAKIVDLPDDPQTALTELDGHLQQNPKDVRAHARKAEILASLGEHAQSAEAWTALLRNRPEKKLRKRALLESAQQWEASCGELRIIDESEDASLQYAHKALTAWSQVEDDVDERAGRLGVIRSLYMLDRIDEGMRRLVKIESKSGKLSQARCLALLFEEQRAATPMAVVRGLDQFARSPDAEVREMAVTQLIRFAETSVEPEVAHTAEGFLVRLTRENGPECMALNDWQSSRQQGTANRLAAAHRTRAVRMTRDALERGRPLEAWRSLEKLLKGETNPSTEVTALLNNCCDQLCNICQEKLDVGDVEAAGEHAAILRVLPKSWLGTAQSDCVTSTLRVHQVAAIRAQAETTLAESKTAVDERRPDDALTTLDPLLERFPPELIPEVQMIRARALAQKGEKKTALQLLERHGPYSDPVTLRLQGVLLAESERGEEAEALLESLPLKFFNVDAFDGLLKALEQQKKWEKLIARLNTLGGELPVRYRPVRQRAVMGAAERLLSNLDPEGAINVLRGNLEDEELLNGPSGPLLVKALLETGRTEEALEILVDETGGIDSVPADLVTMVVDRASHRLDPQQRFQLMRRVPEWERDERTQEFLASNWPRFGSYLPRHGDWTATYRRRTFGEDGQVLTESLETIEIVWKKTYYAVTNDDGSKETWRLSGDLWIRNTLDREWWVPVRAETSPPLEELESPDGVVAQVIEAGHSVTTPKRTFDGCIGVKITVPNQGLAESVRIDLAPELGEVVRSRMIGNDVVEKLELIGLIENKPED